MEKDLEEENAVQKDNRARRKSAPKGTVIDPRIPELRVKSTGAIVDAYPLAARAYTDEDWRHKKRKELVEAIKRNSPVWACPLCDVPVKLSSSTRGNFFFRHAFKEDGRCLHKTRDALPDDVRAAKYNGAKESDAHKEMKKRLLYSLYADSSFAKDSILEERRWEGASPWEYRQPDVQAVRNNQRIAFEVQLSSTLIDEVVARREFYLRQGGILIWIFQAVEKENPRLYQGDILFNNNGNLFVVDDETVSTSMQERRLYLRNYHLIPKVTAGVNSPTWSEGELVPFDALTLDVGTQRAYGFDYESALANVMVDELEFRKETYRNTLRELWLKHDPIHYHIFHDESVKDECIKLRNNLMTVGVTLSSFSDKGSNFESMSHFIYHMLSVMSGKPVGTNLRDILGVWNNIFQNWKGYAWYFCVLASQYQMLPSLRKQDEEARAKRPTNKKGQAIKTFDEKLQVVRDGHNGDYKPSPQVASIAAFLFPDTPHFVRQAERPQKDLGR
ncbi:DUF6035 family protein [Geomonas propionica]|uniref:Competence protein CoiA-like family protein n=1 Tax=Geomonas propionica TaxID=2798582 RepID=A0ABS0YXS8_9BACT|nr:DUF6035 family protein [Geomonas propionica]MBJ6802774.1 hypothetical protein [Geomonas propionica]